MKLSKVLTIVGVTLAMAFPMFADGITQDFSTSTDFAFYPKSDYVAGETHFAPLTGIYSGLEGRITANYSLTIPTPLGEHWLLNSANLNVKPSFEITPVSAKPAIDVTWTPLPFIVFSTGASAGTGWNLVGLQGMGYFNEDTVKYDDATPFTAWFYKFYVQGTFQFDFGAIFPGDWTHVQLMYTYQAYYHGLSGANNGDAWIWQCSGKRANGWQNYQSLILAYGIPNDVLKRVGVMCELDGFYSSDAFKYERYNSNFKSISISPLAQFQFGERDSLNFLVGFSSRRSFVEDHTDGNEELFLTYAGYEWFFNRIALSWNHRF